MMPVPCIAQGPGAPSGATWETLREADFSTVAAADLTSGGTVDVGGVTWSTTNGFRCSTFGPDGSTGFRVVQNSTGVVSSATSPRVYAAMSSIGTVAAGEEVAVQLRWSAGATPGNFARLTVTLYGSSAVNSVNAGVNYQTSPGRWEFGSVVYSSQYTDPGVAVSDSSDAVVEVLISAAGMRVFDRGSWSGAWPSVEGGTLKDAIGTVASAARTTVNPSVASAQLGFSTYRSSGTTDITVHGMRILRRATA
jgi:hypothetical protein